nr:MAG TPA: hypothetical protein [Caudoviricetes sp.]
MKVKHMLQIDRNRSEETDLLDEYEQLVMDTDE